VSTKYNTTRKAVVDHIINQTELSGDETATTAFQVNNLQALAGLSGI